MHDAPGVEGEVAIPQAHLASFLAKYDPEISTLASEVAMRMRRRLPNSLELVYDNYNALAIGFGPTERASDAVFSIAVYPRWVSLFFLHGKRLHDPERRLKGSGKRVRHIVLSSPNDLDDPAIVALIDQALEQASGTFIPDVPYRMIIKSVSVTQRPRRPVDHSVVAAPRRRPVVAHGPSAVGAANKAAAKRALAKKTAASMGAKGSASSRFGAPKKRDAAKKKSAR